MKKAGFFFRFFCLLMAFAFVLAMRIVPVFCTIPPTPVSVSEQAEETFKPRKNKGKN